MTSDPPHIDNVGTEKIGRYPVLRLLGRGSMGAVYLARDVELGRDVAIKTVRFPPQPAEQQAFLVRFRNEARAVGRLRHPSVVAVYDVGEDPEAGPFLVFEYVEGVTLKELIATKGSLSPEEVLALAEQVGGALDAAHREGIIHRDIKPENLLVGRDRAIRLADFGVARVPDAALTGEGQFLGTPCYGAPETLQGREASRASDQFSFGAVLYEAISGVRAFPGKEAVVVAHSVIHDFPKPPSRVATGGRVPAEVDAVVMRAMSKDPAERYGTLSAFVLALRIAYAEAGLVPGVDPASGLDGTGPRRRLSVADAEAHARAQKPFALWPYGAALVLGIVGVLQLATGSRDAAVDASDAGIGASDSASDAGLPGHLAVLDAAAGGTVALASLVDAAVDGAEADGAPDGAAAQAPLSAFEREERAKDALDRAQKALEEGDRDAAKHALDEAFSYDPEHPDIAALRRKL